MVKAQRESVRALNWLPISLWLEERNGEKGKTCWLRQERKIMTELHKLYSTQLLDFIMLAKEEQDHLEKSHNKKLAK